MSDKYEVTVYDQLRGQDRTPSRAGISVAQLDAYLKRTKWRCVYEHESGREWVLYAPGCHVVYTGEPIADSLRVQVDIIANAEGRLPTAVLADIASEPA
ncbi:hypothetical protein WMF38_57680 [Sorangium sp. So ce118]